MSARELRERVLAFLTESGAASTIELATSLNAFIWDVNTACTALANNGSIIRLGRDKSKGVTSPPMVWAVPARPSKSSQP